MNEVILNLFDPQAYGYSSRHSFRLTAYKRVDGQTDTSRYLSVDVSGDDLPGIIEDVDDDWYGIDSEPYPELLALWLSKLLDVTKTED